MYSAHLSNSKHTSIIQLNGRVPDLLQAIGYGHMMNTAYDTAWAARLRQINYPVAQKAVHWLRAHQLEDGSWGTVQPVYHHDRVICTLAAILALTEWDLPEDRERINRGLTALNTHFQWLHIDPAGETIAFEMLLPALMAEARAKGLIERGQTAFLDALITMREYKLARSPGGKISREVTTAFSAEMAGRDGLHLLNVDNLQEPDGSVAFSPSATAYYLINVDPENQAAHAYLQRVMKDGGLPNVAPFNIFEQAWTLWNLALSGGLTEEWLALCQPYLDFLESSWVPGVGVGFAAGYAAKDSDGTSVTYEVLARYGRFVDANVIFKYEEADYFRCFALEANPSVSANIHVLSALHYAGFGRDHPSIQKVRQFLQDHQSSSGYWIDKWHASPYYTTAHAIIACVGHHDSLIRNAVKWMLDTQNPDGSWGYYMPTAEETAYCLQALAVCFQNGWAVPTEVLNRGAIWLSKHLNQSIPPLWIGKCLYSPTLVVRSSILSALMLVNQISDRLNKTDQTISVVDTQNRPTFMTQHFTNIEI